jgi:glycosyltransferase involved in cell wall biosynthesis
LNASPEPIISLIIATRERAQTLAFTLASATNQDSQDFEIVVSDNLSEDDTAAVVRNCRDPRIRYFRTERRLSMCDNYEFALRQARGKYVIFIGDDDAVMPHGLDKLIAIVRAASDTLIYMWPLHIYDWPVGGRGARVAHLAPARPATHLDLKSKAKSVMRLGGWKYYELPSPYHCAVPKAVLDTIRERTGRVFHSTQPDVFTAMAIPALADRALNVGFTITLNGRSARSNGLGFVSKGAFPNIERFIREYGDYRFHPSLYPGVSGAAKMIPDAVLIAHDLFNDFYRGVTFNYESMWAYIYRLKFVSRGQVLRSAREIRKYHRFSRVRFLMYSIVHDIAVLRRKFLDSRAPLGELRQHTPSNIFECVKALDAGGNISRVP